MPEYSCGAPYSWTMTTPGVIAHRFDTPECLLPFTALTVRPGQTGLAFINGEQRVCSTADTHVLTGDVRHSIRDGYRTAMVGGAAQILYHGEITLYDTRLKTLPQETVQLTAANRDETFVFLNLDVRVGDVTLLGRSGAAFQPCADGSGDSEMLLDDPVLKEACAQVTSHVTGEMQQMAAQAADGAAVRQLLIADRTAETLRRNADRLLLPLGLTLDNVRLTLTERSCPYCSRQLSLMDIRHRRCSATNGCGCVLHTCPSCDRFVRSDQGVCPSCREKLLWCPTKGCETFRKVEGDRFCPVCRRACYPPKQREFLRNE
ncbi:MAG: hypothetical protein IJ343_02965 [Clostridia bacterium]|nr:hypothetical protein [Clostridia bacterium]